MLDSKCSVNIMSFNVKYNNTNAGENAWEYRKNRVSSLIRVHDTDIVGLQEVLNCQLKDLTGLLLDYSWVGVGRDDGKEKGEYAPIFYLKSRFELLDSGTFWLSETRDIAGSKGWDAKHPRICTWAKFYDKNADNVFYFFNTHFDHKGEVAKQESARLILKMVDKIAVGCPAIVTGDLNSIESSQAYNIITKKEYGESILTDSKYISEIPHYGSAFTYNDFKGAEVFYHLRRNEISQALKLVDHVDSPIDYIFLKSCSRVLKHSYLNDNWNGFYASDHFPVLSEIVV